MSLDNRHEFTKEYYYIPDNVNQFSFNPKLPPELICPENNSSNVNQNTEFSYTSGDGDGIYMINFFNLYLQFSILTGKNSINFSELINLEENILTKDNMNGMWRNMVKPKT